VIVGDGPQHEALAALVRERDLRHRVQLIGRRDDVHRWLQAFDCFALPSYANEGVPQALVQAMLSGLPCITTDAGAIPEVAIDDQTAAVVAREDTAALAAAIDRMAGDPDLRARLGAAARAHCLQGFTRESMLDRMEAVFAASVAGRPL
jgi:glycosyltransferase involved in cell wall biosynthesis